MAGLDCTHEVERTPTAQNETLIQLKAPTHQRLKLKAVELMPLGSTSASVPIEFDIAKQDDAGVGGGAATAEKLPPIGSETPTATVLEAPWATSQPTGPVSKYSFSLHQQGARLWVPPLGPILIEGGEYWGLRYASATFVKVKVRLYWEE